MLGFPKKKNAEPKVFVTFTFPMPLQPEDRHERFEDPMDEFLEQHKLGKWVGGGTFLNEKTGSLCGCDIQLALYDRNDIARVAGRFNELGAVKGSTFEGGEQEKQAFGSNECLMLLLDMDLPDEIMDANDVGELYDTIVESLEGAGQWLSNEQQDRRYVLYIYGPSFEVMTQRLQPLLDTEPLLQNALIRQFVATQNAD